MIFLKKAILASVVIGFCLNANAGKTKKSGADFKPYEENWESLQRYETPEWFRDAKFGIFIHWGVYSVPAFGSEWYPRHMYMPDGRIDQNTGLIKDSVPTAEYLHHIKTYGPLEKFGYKDFIPMFKAEKFDANKWMDVIVKSGAKYVVPVGEHHDGFAMYNSHVTEWNSVKMGPHRDIAGELAAAAKKRHIKFGLSSHLAFNWNYYNRKKGWDTMDPKYFGLYSRAHEPNGKVDSTFLAYWWDRTKDMIDSYKPDILWFDFYMDRAEFANYHKIMAAYYYNQGLAWNKQVCLQTKNMGYPSFPKGTQTLDIERGKMSDIYDESWQTDTSIGENSWCYVTNWKSKTSKSLIQDLIDIVSKNGNLLLNMGPKADGTIPDDQQQILFEMGQWLKINGEAIYNTRPYKIFGEGPTKVATGHHSEGKNKEMTSNDFRFTANGKNIYVIAMGLGSSNEYKIESFKLNNTYMGSQKIKKAILLNGNKKIAFTQKADGLYLNINNTKALQAPFAIKLVMN